MICVCVVSNLENDLSGNVGPEQDKDVAREKAKLLFFNLKILFFKLSKAIFFYLNVYLSVILLDNQHRPPVKVEVQKNWGDYPATFREAMFGMTS